MKHELSTVSELAKKFGVSRQRMHVLVQTYNLKPLKLGNMLVFPKSEVRKLPSRRTNGKKTLAK